MLKFSNVVCDIPGSSNQNKSINLPYFRSHSGVKILHKLNEMLSLITA